MENVRLFLVIALSFLGLMLWEAWQEDYGTPEALATEQAASPAANAPDLPNAPAAVPSMSAAAAAAPVPAADREQFVSVRTDVLDILISTRGATLERAALPAYPLHVDTPDLAVELLGENDTRQFIYEGGLAGHPDLPNHHVLYSTVNDSYSLADGSDRLVVPFRWRSEQGIEVEKRFVFTRGSYVVEVQYTIGNRSADTLPVHLYEQLKRNDETGRKGMVYTFTGPVLSTPEKRFEKYDAEDLDEQPISGDVANGWVGIMQHYFVAALIPPAGSTASYYSKRLDETHYLVGYVGPAHTVAPGASTELLTTAYVGPKRHDIIASVTPGLELTVDYGALWFIAKPLFRFLQYIHDVTGNWGYAIILLTVILKLLFYPLSAAGYRSMANMRKVQPRMLALRDRYKDDRNALNQAMMKLYKDEKINPLGGCLPILIQIPVFISLYWVLLESVEMRQAPFIGWVTDLSDKDPYFVLPLLMGISMYFQQKLNPAPLDPMQAKVMQILPFVFTIFFAFFPSGLVLYWVINNILSIAQQWQITRAIERASS